jgi:uncharacterized protein YodC (DUF2158 family)
MEIENKPMFKEGDVVMLKSGGPNMTILCVNNILQVISYDCVWFDKKGKYHHANHIVEVALLFVPNVIIQNK